MKSQFSLGTAALSLFLTLPLCQNGRASELNATANSEQAEQAPSSKKESKGFYLTVGGGGSWMLNQTGSAPVTSFAGVGYRIDVTEAFNGGLAIEAGAGYDFGAVRAEITYVRSNQTMESAQGTLVQQTISAPLNTRIIAPGSSSNSLFVSTYYDIGTRSRITPYIGGGIGITQINWGGMSSSGFAYNLYQSPGTNTALGYQAKIGVSYQLSSKVDAYAEGTYQGASPFSIGTFTSNSPSQTGVNYDSLNQFGGRIGVRVRL